jgi:hypothetical protein
VTQPDQKTLDAEQKRLHDELAKFPWFRGSYWGHPLGRTDPSAEPGWVVQIATGHRGAEEIVSAAGSRLRLSGAAVQSIVLTTNPRPYQGGS